MRLYSHFAKQLKKNKYIILFSGISFFAGALLTLICINSIQKSREGTYFSTKQGITDPSVANMHVAGVSAEEMIYSLENKEEEDFEKSYIVMMTYYLENGIELTRLAQGKVRHSELGSQTRSQEAFMKEQMDTLLRWYDQWGYKKLDERQQYNEATDIPHNSGIDGH